MTNMRMKRCTKCGTEYPATNEYFHTRPSNKTWGLRSRCKTCISEDNRNQYASNPEPVKNASREWRLNNSDKSKESQASYRKEKRQHYLERCQKYYHERKHIPHVRIQRQVALLRYRALKRALPASFTPIDWQICLKYFHNCCAYCGNQQGFLPGTELTADHFIAFTDPNCPGTVPSNMVPSCGSCNSSKRDRSVKQWLFKKIGKRKAQQRLDFIQSYFALIGRPSGQLQMFGAGA